MAQDQLALVNKEIENDIFSLAYYSKTANKPDRNVKLMPFKSRYLQPKKQTVKSKFQSDGGKNEK